MKLNKGVIKLFGNSDINTIRENTSVVDQHTKLFHDTVMNNILYGNKATEADVRRILKNLVQIFTINYPMDYIQTRGLAVRTSVEDKDN